MAGRGGMLSKINTARRMSGLGITMHIAAGHEKNIVTRLMENEELGTTILPQKKISAVKRWLATAPEQQDESTARVVANNCLAEQLKDPTRVMSILPVGLTAIKGQFAKNDRVQVVDEKGMILAVGLARYDDMTLQERLGQQKQPVFLHTDALYRTM